MENNSPIEEIYSRYAKKVNMYIRSVCKNPDLADDITAETFLKAVKNIDSFKGGNILTWLCAIAKNTYFDYMKKKERKELAFDDEMANTLPDTAASPESAALERASRMELYKQLQSLDTLSREVVYLRMFTELSFKEIGAVLGRSENWARVVFYRSKNKLKGMIDNEI